MTDERLAQLRRFSQKLSVIDPKDLRDAVAEIDRLRQERSEAIAQMRAIIDKSKQ